MEPPVASRPGSSSCAAFTIVRDEPVFLTLWHRHYARAFANCDLFVLHHVATDEESADGPFAAALSQFEPGNVTRLVNAEFDPQWLKTVVSDKLEELLGTYEAVLFAEADELLFVAPGHGAVEGSRCGLREFVQQFAQDAAQQAVRCVGHELHHDFAAGEPPYDASRPILAQRRRWHRNALYDKALLTKRPLTWSLGFHTCAEAVAQDERLRLLHLHKYDLQAYLARHEARAKYVHSAAAVANEWNVHYRRTGAELLAQYMSLAAPLEEVPAWVRDALPGI